MITRALLFVTASLMLAPAALAEGDAAAGAKAFKKCKACHAVGVEAKNKVGPQLNGIVGRAWGTVEDFKYSKGREGTLLQIAEGGGKVWDVPTLTAYLRKPKDVIPKGKMAFPGLRKDADLENVIFYLAGFDANGSETDPAPVLEANAGE